jgi:hypothetical protein
MIHWWLLTKRINGNSCHRTCHAFIWKLFMIIIIIIFGKIIIVKLVNIIAVNSNHNYARYIMCHSWLGIVAVEWHI